MPASNSLNMDTSGVQTYNATTGALDGSAMTQYLVVCGDANNKIQNIAGIGTSGQVLTSNGAGALPTFQDAGGGGGGSSTAGAVVDLVDDFIANSYLGNLNWGVNSAPFVNPLVSTESNRPGILQFTTSTSNPALARLSLSDGSQSNIIIGGGPLTIQFYIQIPILSTGTQRFSVEMGLAKATHNELFWTDDIKFHYKDDDNSGKWQIKTKAASVVTTQNTDTTADTDWHVYKIIVNSDATSVAFYIDGVEVSNSPITTNIPTAPLSAFIALEKSVGTTARTILLDLFTLNYELTTPR